jgi:hypothetical protein
MSLAQNYSLWLWVPACAGTTDVEWRHGKLFQPSLLRQTQSVCACERSEAIHREPKQKLDCFAALAMTALGQSHLGVLAARCVRGVKTISAFP